MRRRSTRFGLMALIALAISGCGGDEGYRFTVYPTAGKVTRKGQPVPKAMIRFHPVNPDLVKVPDGKPGSPPSLTTETEADGSFIVSSYYADDGMPAGDYVVTVAAGQPESDVENSDGLPPKRSPANAKNADPYRDAKTSPLKATVKPGDNRFTFELN